MNREEYQQVKKIFQSALDIAPDERAEYLNEKCSDNPALRHEVEKLLSSFDNDYLEQPAIEKLAEKIIDGNLSIGQEIGKEKRRQKIGAGGMGEVYLAEDTKLKRKTALKLLSTEFSSNKQRVMRFEQEAQAASALNHPNIITIYEIGESDGVNFIATEFIEGKTLRQKLKTGKLSINESLEIARQVTSAIVAVHQAGILHRDIKPENIMIRPDGLAKVLDFGLAKLTAPSTDSENAETETLVKGLTKPGMILGTLHYMSPEQVRGLPLDARSDIFSLGVVLYEMLAGKDPFAKSTQGDVIAAILTENPPPLSGVPSELQRIITKALQKDKEERYQVSKEMLLDIKSLTREIEFEANTDSPRITQLLVEWGNGSQTALENLIPLVYDELRQMAKRYMRRQPLGHTFQTTELIHEAYLKLAGQEKQNWQNRAHFFGVAAKAMRHILVDYARTKQSKKRGGWQERITLAEPIAIANEKRSDEIIALDEALKRLSAMDERKSRVVELKYFGGLTNEEIAEVLKISPETVKRDWRFSRTWLLRELANN